MNRPILLAIIMAAIIAGIGYASISASKYNEVGSLSGIDAPTRVTVRGNVVSLGTGSGVILYNGEAYRLDARGPYGIAEAINGGDSIVVFLLEGDNGFRVAAVYQASEFLARYGGSPIIDPSIVIDGVYMPSTTMTITIGGDSVEVPVIDIYTILKGCHASYGQEQATVG
ncbi:MAG: hypothetical protein F7C08_00355 [Desulfurococcales archaeon]|nr:hypothetical protein [Desulfurococcales archaeon]MCE4604979.1 hypothetical protein [Desulfurococcales archaeon]